MEREIRFRAWDKKRTGAWNSFLVQDDNLYEYFQELQNCRAEYGCDWELMQFTGLKDKNGKEIYEGDLLSEHRYKYKGKWKYKRPYLVEEKIIDTDGFGTYKGWNVETDYDGSVNHEIIGNIYENPELLN